MNLFLLISRLSSIIITAYFDAQIVSDLASGSPFKLVVNIATFKSMHTAHMPPCYDCFAICYFVNICLFIHSIDEH